MARRDDMVCFFQRASDDVEFAQLARRLCAGVRTYDETDTETLERIFKEYKACKYQGVPIPEDKTLHSCTAHQKVKARSETRKEVLPRPAGK